MTVKLDHHGWTAAQNVAPCVICHQPAILRSPRGKPCHWTCAVTWTNAQEARRLSREARSREVIERRPPMSRCTMADPCGQEACGACYPDLHDREHQANGHEERAA